MQQRVPWESARQLLEVTLKHDVILAAATALCSGNSDCAHLSSGEILPQTNHNNEMDHFRGFSVRNRNESRRLKGNLVNKDCRRGTEDEVGLENEEARTLDLMADFMEEIDVRCAILLHAEAIEDRSDRNRSQNSASKGLGFCFFSKRLF